MLARTGAAVLSSAPVVRTSPTLFLVVLGGRTASSHIELHDVRFVAGRSIDDTLPELRRQWFGRREGLHLDSFMAVRAVDGYAVRLGREPSAPGPERLWFVNLGAYRPDSLAELHHFGLVVATSAVAAKAAAKRQWLKGALQQHKDDLWAVTTAWRSSSWNCWARAAGMCSWSPIPSASVSPRCRTGSATGRSEGLAGRRQGVLAGVSRTLYVLYGIQEGVAAASALPPA